MKTLHQSRYFSIFYEQENQLFYYIFNKETYLMSSQEYIEELKIFTAYVKQYLPKKVLGNMIDFEFTISPDIQEWVNQNLFAVYRQIGFRKIAILLSAGIFESVSIQQTMQEDTSNSFETQYFDNETTARKWLLKE